MDLNSTYAVVEPDVIAESVAGETLIINLKSGVYYSSAGVGDEIWRYLRDGHSVGRVVEMIYARYAGDASTIRDEVLLFVSRLREEELIVEAEVVAEGAEATALGRDDAPPFAPPVLDRYTDYQELLLLDPIHDVHELSGWPVVKRDATA